jgi:TolA-binding protein
MLRTLGKAFDETDDITVNDGDQLNAMLLASERWLTQTRSLARNQRGSRTRTVVMVSAAALGIASLAAAATVVVRQAHKTPHSAVTATTASPSPIASTKRRAAELSEPLKIEPSTGAKEAVETSEAKEAESNALGHRASADPKGSVGVSGAKPSASALLAYATLLRHKGERNLSAQLFRKLQQRYPGSKEAVLSRVALGSLFLEQGQSAQSLEQFERYLGDSKGQPLDAEALYGKGRALSQLGRRTEAESVWRALVERYPKSPYVSFARKQLPSAP